MSKQDYILINQVIDATKSQINSPSKGFFVTKIVLVVVIYIFLVANSMHDLVSPTYVPECVRDEMQELTLPINEFLAQNPFYRSALIILSSLLIDVCVFIMATRWIVFGKNFKTFFTGAMFYALRAFLQNVFFLKFPTNYIWGHPGLFSITVPYQPANDFFYSGHLGLCVICYIEFKRDNFKLMKYFCLLTIVVEFFTLLVTRAHYFIDLVTGMIVAHYLYLVSDWIWDYFAQKEKKARKHKVSGSSLELTGKQSDAKPFVNNKGKKEKC